MTALRHPSRRSLARSAALGTAISSLLLVPSLRAASLTWANVGTSFNAPGNFTPSQAPTNGDVVTFGPSSQSVAPNVVSSTNIDRLVFSGLGYSLSSSPGAKLTLGIGAGGVGASNTAITVTNATALVTNDVTISSALALGQGNGNIATFAFSSVANSTLLLSGDISEATGGAATNISLTSSQTSNFFSFAGNNSYAGTTSLTAGVKLNINSNTALGTGALVIATSTATLDNTSGKAITLTNGNAINLTTGNFIFTGTNDLSFGSGVLTISGAASRAVTVNGSMLSKLTIGSVDADTVARTLVKNGVGTLVIANAAGSNFQGGSTVSAGTLLMGNKSALGTGTINITTGTLGASTNLSGANAVGTTVTFSTGASVGGSNNLELSNLTVGTTKTLTNNIAAGAKLILSNSAIALGNGASASIFTINGSGDTLISGNLTHNSGANTSNLVYSGIGTLTLAGSANTYNGVVLNGGTTVNGGTVIIIGLNTASTPALTLNGGNLVLDLTTGNDRWNATAIPVLRGSALTVKGKATSTSTQTLGNPTFDAYQARIVVNSNGGSGTTLTLGNSWAGSNGASVFIDLSTANSTLTSSPTLTRSLVLDGSAILKDSAGAVGFATVTGGNVVRYANTGSGNGGTTGAITLTPGSNLTALNYVTRNAGTETLTGSNASQLFNTLQIDSTSGTNLLDLNGKTFAGASGDPSVILVTGSADYEIKNSLGTGTLGAAGTTANVLKFQQWGTGTLNVSANIGLTAGSLTKTGPGLVNLTGTNAQTTGNVIIRDGALQVTANQGNLGSGGLYLSGGVLQSSGTFSRALGTGAGQVRWQEINANAGSGGGFAAKGGVYNIQLGGVTTIQNWETTSFVQEGKALIFGSTSADNVVDFQNALGLGAVQREVRIVDNPSVATDIARLSGVISSTANSAGGLLKTGDGVLQLTNTGNTFSGPTTINSGTLHASVNGSLAQTTSVTVQNTGTLLLGDTGTATVLNNAAPITLSGGAIKSGGGSEGTAATVANSVNSGSTTSGLGVLTLTASSSLDFGAGNASTYVFDGFSATSGLTLTVANWTPNGFDDTLGSFDSNSGDRLVFGNITDVNDLLSHISFGGGFTTSAIALGTPGVYEIGISAIPEPATIYSLLMVGGLLGVRERRRLRKLVRR